MKAFLCANCFKYQLTPPKPACALKSALEVSLWTLPKWPKTGGPPAEPSVWKWADSLPRKDVTIQIRKFFAWNFIRQIYQNLIYHDLSWFIIYSYLFMELTSQKVCYLDPCSKVTSTLSICSTGPLHRRGQTWTWSVGRFSNCQLPQPGKRLEIRPPALEERLPFWPKETPIKETAKVLHQRPQASEDHILWDIWFDFTKKKTLPWSFSPDVFLIHADLPMGGSHWLLMHQWNVMWNVAARTMEAEKQWAWDVQSGQPANPDFETCFVVTHASPIATKNPQKYTRYCRFSNTYLIACLCTSYYPLLLLAIKSPKDLPFLIKSEIIDKRQSVWSLIMRNPCNEHEHPKTRTHSTFRTFPFAFIARSRFALRNTADLWAVPEI